MISKIASDILDAIKSAQNVLVCGHVRPDGDCVGAALAMRRLCELLGKNADAVCDADKPYTFGFLPDYEYFCETRFPTYDLFISVDCATVKRLGVYAKYLDAAKKSIHIDHHLVENMFADINYVDTDACSTCFIIYELFAETGLFDKPLATMLYTGLSTDTGNFMHSNTTARAFEVAAKLCEFGLDIGYINHEIYRTNSINKMRLMSRAIAGIELFSDGAVALMKISTDDLDACECASEDTEGLIDYASSIRGVAISICMCEQPGSLYRVSLRSVNANVAEVAAKFGGGGHKLAAGCIIKGTFEQVSRKIVEAAQAAL